jgi:cytosine/adenosine deaminase-related metal-dependent hydrolase
MSTGAGSYLFRNLKLLDPRNDDLRGGYEVLVEAGKLGVIEPGAWADLLLVDGDPLADVTLLEGEGKHLAAIMKGGDFHKNRLASAA